MTAVDYPAPVVEIDPATNELLVTSSYVQEIGVFDKFAITYGYGVMPASAMRTETSALDYLQVRPYRPHAQAHGRTPLCCSSDL